MKLRMRRVKYFWGLPNQLVEVELYFKYKNNCNGMQFTPKWWFSVLLALLTETSIPLLKQVGISSCTMSLNKAILVFKTLAKKHLENLLGPNIDFF